MTLFRLPCYITLLSIVALAITACGAKNEPEQPAEYMTALFCNILDGERIPTVDDVSKGYPSSYTSFAEGIVKNFYDIRRGLFDNSRGMSALNCATSVEIVSEDGKKAEVLSSITYDIFKHGKPYQTISFKVKDSLELIDGTWTVVHSVSF